MARWPRGEAEIERLLGQRQLLMKTAGNTVGETVPSLGRDMHGSLRLSVHRCRRSRSALPLLAR